MKIHENSACSFVAKLWWESEPRYTKVTSATLYNNCPTILFWLDDAYCVYTDNNNISNSNTEVRFGRCDLGTRSITEIADLGPLYKVEDDDAYSTDCYKLYSSSFLLFDNHPNWTVVYLCVVADGNLIKTDVTATIDDKFYYGTSSNYNRPTYESFGELITVFGSTTKLSTSANPSDIFVIRKTSNTTIELTDHMRYSQSYDGIGTLSNDGSLGVSAAYGYGNRNYYYAVAMLTNFNKSSLGRTHLKLDEFSRNGQPIIMNSPAWLTDSLVAIPVNNLDSGNGYVHGYIMIIETSGLAITKQYDIASSDDPHSYTPYNGLSTKYTTYKSVVSIDDLGNGNCIYVSEDTIGFLNRSDGNILTSSNITCSGVRAWTSMNHIEYNNGYYICLGPNWVYITCS